MLYLGAFLFQNEMNTLSIITGEGCVILLTEVRTIHPYE